MRTVLKQESSDARPRSKSDLQANEGNQHAGPTDALTHKRLLETLQVMVVADG
jgi:hypothetical protein